MRTAIATPPFSMIVYSVLDEGVHFIQKPFSKKDLAVRMSEALDRG